jgi:hypothetical protein
MIRWLHKTFTRLREPFARKSPGPDRSQLVGMYLEHTNRQAGGGLRGANNRQRQNGKYSSNRRRS